MCNHFVQRAIQRQPFHRGLRTHFVDARDVVHRVADQREVVDDLRGPDPEFLVHTLFIERFAGHGVHQPHHRIDELGDVLVASGNNGLHAQRFGLLRQRADDIVGFHAIDHQQWPAHCPHTVVQRLDLLRQVIGHWRTMGFVLRIPVVAEGLSFCVEYASYIIRRRFLAQLLQHAEHALDGAGRFAVPVAQVGKRMECAIEVGRAIHQH